MRKGFTLIELIVVIAVIAVLAAIIAPNALKAIDRAKVSAAVGNFKNIKTAAYSYYADCNQWPVENTSGQDFLGNTSALDNWDGPYIDAWPGDIWGEFHWCNNNGTVAACDEGFGSSAVYFEIVGVPAKFAGQIDDKLDGSDGYGAGNVRFNSSGETYVHILIENTTE